MSENKNNVFIPVIRFKHQYIKLQNDVFPTVRGKSRILDYPTGSIVQIVTPEVSFYAVVIESYHRAIHELSRSFINLDGSYKDHYTLDHETYVNLLNSFRKYHKITDYNTFISIFWLERIRCSNAWVLQNAYCFNLESWREAYKSTDKQMGMK